MWQRCVGFDERLLSGGGAPALVSLIHSTLVTMFETKDVGVKDEGQNDRILLKLNHLHASKCAVGWGEEWASALT